MKKRIEGIVPPVVTPLKNDGTLDSNALCKHHEYLLKNRVAGIFVLGTTGEFFSFAPQNGSIMVSALKMSENKNGIILRIWNTTGDAQSASISTILPVSSVTRVRLDETPVEELALKDGKFEFELLPHKIETFLLK